METELLFYTDPYKKNFSAEIIELEKAKKGWSIVLNRTCFYPEGGGQPADRGSIDGVPVIDVKKKNGVVFHFLADEPAHRTGTVSCAINWKHRFDYMQQHSGQHIISAVLFKSGYNTVSVHQGEKYTSIEIDAEYVNDEELEKIEEEVNNVIAQNFDVKTFFVKDTEIPSLNLRRAPKVTGSIRIVEINGYDRVPCGGVHTGTTGEVLFAKILFTEKIRGHARIAWVLGNRVLEDYRNKQKVTQTLSDLFSVTEKGIVSFARKMLEENRGLKRDSELRKKEYAAMEMEKLFSRGKRDNTVSIIVKEYKTDDKTYLKQLLAVLPSDRIYALCLVNRIEGGLQWALAVTVPGFNFADVKDRLLPIIGGRGGGKAPVYQGIGNNQDGIDAFFESFRELFHI